MFKLTAQDKHILSNIVNRLHVSEPDKEVIQVVSAKLPKATPEQLRVALRFAIEQHRRNQDLYNRVVSGRF